MSSITPARSLLILSSITPARSLLILSSITPALEFVIFVVYNTSSGVCYCCRSITTDQIRGFSCLPLYSTSQEVPIYSRFIRPTPELAIFLSFYYNSSGISQMCRSIPPSLAIPTIAVLHKFRSYIFSV